MGTSHPDFGRYTTVDPQDRAALVRLLANADAPRDDTPRQRIRLVNERKELLDDLVQLAPVYRSSTPDMARWIRYHLIFTLFAVSSEYTDELYEAVSQKFGDNPTVVAAFNRELERLNELECISTMYDSKPRLSY